MSADRGTSQEQEQDTVDCRSCYGNSAVPIGRQSSRSSHGNSYRPGYAVAISMEILLMLKYHAKPFLSYASSGLRRDN